MKSILAVKNLAVRFGDISVLENVSFEIEPGDFLMILGPNGAGKSVLLKSILGILAYEGEVRVFGKDIKQARSRIGYVPQYIDFDRTFPLTVREVIGLGCGQTRSVAGCTHVGNMVKMVGVEDKIDSFFGSLSGGQIRKVLIARALVNRPKLLFLDEPLAGVDVVGEKSFYEMLAKWHREFKLTTVMVSHDYGLVSKIASKVLCLNKKMTCFGGPGSLGIREFELTFGKGVDLHVH
ncbi:ABC transporter ATP-binding protein [Patescibacteria group bacterium]|nr:ABC transporter ATP-binding protein [Patescibacteria group bacterium]